MEVKSRYIFHEKKLGEQVEQAACVKCNNGKKIRK